MQSNSKTSRTDLQEIVNSKRFQDRFWSKVLKTDSCWIWTGSLSHGRAQIGGSKGNVRYSIGGSVAVWIMLRGPIPEGFYVCHNCPGGDNGACINPDHLWLGTQKQNMEDAKQKGRSTAGERHPMHKLCWDEVHMIRHLFTNEGQSAVSLAAQFKVSRPTVTRIVNRRIWQDAFK